MGTYYEIVLSVLTRTKGPISFKDLTNEAEKEARLRGLNNRATSQYKLGSLYSLWRLGGEGKIKIAHSDPYANPSDTHNIHYDDLISLVVL